ncbi:translation initiation factor IF-6 [Methanobacterium petrolearium]|uniref:translation initiation factor IF-6 n=1 Tax=Methanobacterium petrolearium TaxID=710190 RepID=UPI001AE461E8|nr:translation initiation factor IF-6 [Methanobacterium petrolearium]MBP1946645.1 translation initiation factor 6 [Methanobacterium petrolearium]BDZ72130.1 translation initiation factor 6 [Methanobacterium petrolearium]
MIRRVNLAGNPNLGVSLAATDKVALAPPNLGEKMVQVVEECLEVPVIKTPISGSSLAGALAVGNSRGILVSKYAFDKEIKTITESGLKVERIPDRLTAVGNIILANDHGALVNPLLSEEAMEVVSETLDVDVVRSSIANFKITGSVAVATNKGVLVHPSSTPKELEFMEKTMKVPADIGTVNQGTKLVGAGTVANSNGVLVGENTTGPEMARIEESLGFLEELL